MKMYINKDEVVPEKNSVITTDLLSSLLNAKPWTTVNYVGKVLNLFLFFLDSNTHKSYVTPKLVDSEHCFFFWS